jgi:hypothetical protein
MSAFLVLLILGLFAVLFGVAVLQTVVGVVVGLGCAVAAVLYGYKTVNDQRVKAQRSTDVASLMQLTPFEFERHVADAYAKMGYRVELTRGGGDQGIDVLASLDDRRLGIQCKRYTGSVGNDAVQQAIAGKIYYSCSHAVVVATSAFTPAARELADRAGVQLLDGYAYSDLVNRLRVAPRPGIRSFVPRGRPLVVQTALIACAFIAFFVHWAHASPIHFERLLDRQTYGSANSGLATFAETTFAGRVQAFYADLDSRNYVAAYGMLSPTFRSGSTYEKWKAGYATTIRNRVAITPISESMVGVSLEAQDQMPSGLLIRHFAGTWAGVRGADGLWYLDDGQFRLASAPK